MGRKSRGKGEARVAAAGASPTVGQKPSTSGQTAAIVAILVILTLAVFAQVRTHSFLSFDDPQFVTANEHVTSGLTPPSVTWALTSTSLGWYPLTWLSHMLDVNLWDMNAGMHLVTNAIVHLLSVCILFLALQRMTMDTWRSAVVAALFAIHPTRVESVAWVSERKDTLSTLMAMIALLVYAAAPRRRWLLFALMALSLMAKQMYITLPFVLLLLDFWPLQRMQSARDFRERIVEKLPLFALTVFGAAMAIVGQRNLAAMQSMQAVPLGARLANAAVAYVRYLGKLFVPVNLAVFYPLQPVAATTAAAAAILLAAISVAAFHFRNRAPWLFTGWFWFVGTLVPVIGIVQIGTQAIADRYTYFSFVGLFLVVVWGGAALARRAAIPESIPAAIAVAAIAIFALIAYRQTGYWKDTETLFVHTIEVTPPNPLAEYSLGQALELTDPDRAIRHLQRSITLVESVPGSTKGWHAQAYVGLGTARMMQARSMVPGPQRTAVIEQSIADNRRALQIDPKAPHAKNNIQLARQWLGTN